MSNRKYIALALCTAALVASLTGCASPNQTIVGPCHVTDKSTSGSGDHVKYLVFTDKCGVLTVDDAILLNVWNSSDTYNGIKVGSDYKFSTYGFRNGFISSYPNIITAKAVAK